MGVARLGGPTGSRWVASQELLKEARRLDLSSTEGCFRLGDLAEALHHELPEVADLAERLAIDLEVDRASSPRPGSWRARSRP
jgi:hypothetical protein